MELMDEKLTMVLTRNDAAKILSALIYIGKEYKETRTRFIEELDRATKRWYANQYGS